MRQFLLSAIIALTAFAAHAHADTDSVPPYRPVAAAYTLGVGSAHVCDTYLTPLHYDGWSAALGYERLQAMRFNPQRWVMQLDGRFTLDRTQNPARNATINGIDLRIAWAMMWRTQLPAYPSLSLYAGGYAEAHAGALMLARNGNNPVQARAAATVGVTAMAVCRARIGRLPVTLRYQAALPLTGAFFSPDYGELYYEIYLGNHSGLVHAAWPGNYFKLDNTLTADLHLGNTALRLGYACGVFSSKTSGIVARDISHRFIIGVTTEFITIGRSRGIDPHARIISAIY